ncbi:MAG: NADPH-dependent 7-cyano-7-deazaguanine reductase QueF [Epsilonproteobacteria bacterium]|nr:NADPH-dependent 7-cyano-7-deazaguanine reductase QueF [Campylobacterota bacterium]NPA64430.1 NADPH-dependent 7-cyano-7-deazaguanine reductase QueF [Campylobacterota bacterium]
MRYGEEEIKNFDPQKDLEIWPNRHQKSYLIKITLPEFSCLCPRSGYPDYAKIYLEYVPDKYVVELKALKLYINSFRDRYISHEDSANEIFDTLYERLRPKKMRLIADFNPRGNVHTIIEIDSEKMEKER